MLNRIAAMFSGRAWLRWLPTLAGFPIGGVLARVVAGPADDLAATLAGGALAGVALGLAQGLALRPRIALLPWVAATAAGLAAGLGLGATVVDYGTGAADLALQGAITGAVLGAAQTLVLRARVAGAWRWAPLTAVAWAVGWTVTRAAGIDVERHWHMFGSSGALVATVLTGLIAVTIVRGNAEQRTNAAEGVAA